MASNGERVLLVFGHSDVSLFSVEFGLLFGRFEFRDLYLICISPELDAIFLRQFFGCIALQVFACAAQVDQIGGHDGPNIFSGRTMASKSSIEMPSFTASSRKVVPFLWAVLAILAARS